MLESVYPVWNEKINLISRKDIFNLSLHHILHSLSIGWFYPVPPGTFVMDAGSGGGFPAIPLAILFPDAFFTLVDSIGKKMVAASEIIRETGLDNVETVNRRFETMPPSFDWITGRAVSNLDRFVTMTSGCLKTDFDPNRVSGIFYLTGGDPPSSFSKSCSIHWLKEFCPDPYFSTKYLVHIPRKHLVI